MNYGGISKTNFGHIGMNERRYFAKKVRQLSFLFHFLSVLFKLGNF